MHEGTSIRIGNVLHPVCMTRGQIRIVALCALCVLVDGADFQLIGFVAPTLMRDLSLTPDVMGYVFASGILGMMAGSILLAPLGDRFGRRPVLIASMLSFGVAMAATAAATNGWQLIALRFATGIGLGSVMPLSAALAGEFSPSTRRISLVIGVSACFPVGAVLGGLAAAALIPLGGWQAVFLVGGVVPVVIAAVLFATLPESVEFLATKGRHREAAETTRSLGYVTATPAGVVFIPEDRPGRPSVAGLFEGGRARLTIVIWSIYALNLLVLMFLSSWLPTLIQAAGRSQTEAIMAGTVLQLGGVMGALVMSRFIRRIGFTPVMVVTFVAAAVTLVCVGVPGIAIETVFVLIGLCGFTVLGAQQALNGMATLRYPAHLRSTGIGWALGMGRLGSIVGPIAAGWLLGIGYGHGALLQFAAVPALLSAAAMLLLPRGRADGGVAQKQAGLKEGLA